MAMTPDRSFIHLHLHSEFSVLDGAVRLKNLMEAAVRYSMPAVALTDHGNMFGAVSFYKEARSRGIKPILGCETYVAPGSRFDKKPGDREGHFRHLVLLVKNETGYRNLCRLLTQAYLEGFYYRPRIDKELLAAHGAGLIGLSSCLKGEVADFLGKGLGEAAEAAARELASFFEPGDFYIEIMDHGLPEQREVNPLLIELARRAGLPLVATNDVHYLNKEDADSHEVLLCIQTNKKLSDQERMRFGSREFYFKSAEEMWDLFGHVPEALENTVKIASRCGYDFPASAHFLPHFQPPDGVPVEEYFERLAREGLERKLPALERKRAEGRPTHTREEYEQRLEREIRLVEEMQFPGYFLIVWDMIREARARGIPVGPGRGSAAGSLLAYCLDITQVDPLEYGLLFERFLNPERISLPDIDIDFCGRRRSEVLEYVTSKYGQDNVCQIITFGTMAARAAIRDAGRVLEVPLPEVDRVAKMIPFGPDSSIETALKDVPQLRELREKNAKISLLLDAARKIEGQVRHPSIHAAGIVLTPEPLVHYLPLYKSVKGEVTTQFPMQDLEAIGLLKMDLLGLRNLTVIRETIEALEREKGLRIDLESVSLDDPETFALFQAGLTDGVFQFESPGMKELLRSFRPEEFRDLIALNALYRPGPLKSGMTADFVKVKNHPEEIKYDFPELEPILRETRGIIVYQEQVMQLAVQLAGFSLAEADILRKAMGKKKSAMMQEQKQRFLQGVRRRGISAQRAAQLFSQVEKFAEYGFNKSHSAAYALLAYHTAYLKAHHAVHFMSSLLTSEAERGATDQVVKYLAECQELGIKVLPPDVNFSEVDFSVSEGDIRFGLAAVKNVGRAAAEGIVAARKKRGRFASPFEVMDGLDSRVVNRKVLESLIKAGAFDSLGLRRSQCFHLLDAMIDYSHDLQKALAANQTSLFGPEAASPPPMPDEVRGMGEWDETLRLSYEKDALGFYISNHPLVQYGKRLRKLTSHEIAGLDEERDGGREVRLAGVIGAVRPRKTKADGEPFATFSLEDLSGRIEVAAFPETYNKYYEYIRADGRVWIKGKFTGEGENRKVVLQQLMPLDEAFSRQAKRVVIKVFVPGLEESVIGELKELLAKHPGECPLFFDLETPHAHRVVLQSGAISGIDLSEPLTRRIQALLGENAVYVEY
ncbi:MAG: DNA polymerase III subunit alpha [Candidatus Aminicenantes bacterium]|nr:DNA polymerase III subunit alpha [Candidatus Aminicenantes bacterium]